MTINIEIRGGNTESGVSVPVSIPKVTANDVESEQTVTNYLSGILAIVQDGASKANISAEHIGAITELKILDEAGITSIKLT